MARNVRRTLPPVVFLTLLALVGCQSKPRVVPVSGTVTVDGRPLAEGVLYFKTVQTGALERFEVKDGKFEGKAAEGERRVEISATRMKSVMIDGKPVDVPDNYLPARYNLDSTLTATVTVPGPNEFAFDLTTK